MSRYSLPFAKRWIVFRILPIGLFISILFCAADLLLPGSDAKAYKNDDQGRVISRTLAGGRRIEYRYDKAGLLVERSNHRVGGITGWSYPTWQAVKYAYDLAGNRIATDDGLGKSQYVYDEDNRLKEVTASDEKRIGYEFDTWGNVRRLSLPGGTSLEYRRDVVGNISSLSDSREHIARYEYHSDENQAIRRLSNGVSTTYEYSPAGLLLSIQHLQSDGTLIGSFRYEYGSDRRLMLAEETAPEGTSISHYEYDPEGRLAKAWKPGGSTVSFEYDSKGNRTSKTDEKGTTRYRYDQKGRLIEAGNVSLAYDVAGNLISKQSGSERTVYGYDRENRLAEVRNNRGVVRYSYEGDGNLVRREINGKSISYLNDPLADVSQIVAEDDDKGNVSRYLMGNSRIGKRGSDGAAFYLEDLSGSTRFVVDGSGKVTARYDYSPFGEPLPSDGKPATEFLYSGELWDADTRLLYLRARFYDPELGRFISSDPIQGSPLRPESFNQYVYANNDPLNQMDPFGLQAIWRQSPPPPPSPPYDQDRILRDLRRQHPSTQLFQPPPPPPFESYWRRLQEIEISNWLPFYLRNAQRHQNEEFSFGKELLNMTMRGEWFHADTPIQHDLRAALVGLSFIPGLGRIPSWVLFTNDRLYELSHDQTGKFLVGVGKKGVSLVDERLGYGVKLYSLADELRQGAVLPWLITEGRQIFIPRQSEDPLDHLSDFDPFFAGSLQRTRNIFLPPPPGGGGSFPLVGGVYLDQTAKVIGDLGAITGASFDAGSGRLILIGDKQTKLPPMKPEYLAAALRAVYSDSPHEPGVSIDPNPQNPYSPMMLVNFFGNTGKTRLGWVMFEADRVMKGYSVGVDNLTKQPVKSEVPGYQSVTAMALLTEARNGAQLWSRFWLVPEPMTARVSEDGDTILFDPVKIRVKTQTMKWEGGKLAPAEGAKDPQAEAFAAHFTERYEDFARENPIYAELKQVACAVALAKWMRQRNAPVDWNFVRTFAGTPFQTPDITPAAFAEQTQSVDRGQSVLIRKLTVFGGVDMSPQLQTRSQNELTRLRNQVDKRWVEAERQEKASAQFDFDRKTYEMAALPPVEKRELGSFSLSEADLVGLPVGEDELAGLPGLSRHYNSLHNEATEYGFSWSLLLPRLEFEAVAEKGKEQYISAGPNKRVRAQRFILADQFGLCHERFVKPFADEGFDRIGFAPEGASSNYRGVYPEGDGTYRLIFADLRQAIFDSSGKLRVLLVPSSKAVYDYDNRQRPVAIRLSSAGRNWQVSFEYDGQGRLSARVCGEGRTTYEYDQANNLAKVKSGDIETVYRYNERRLLTEVIVNGKTVAQNDYDEKGRLVKQRDSNENITEQHIEAAGDGKIVTVKQGASFVRRRYDARLRLIELEYGDGSSRQYSYNDAISLTGVHAVLPNGGQFKIEASPDRKTLVMEDPRRVRREYRFGPNGQLAEVLINNKPAATCRYDANDKLIEISYENGAAERFEYDQQGRLSFYRRTASGGEAETGDALAFLYDEQGRTQLRIIRR